MAFFPHRLVVVRVEQLSAVFWELFFFCQLHKGFRFINTFFFSAREITQQCVIQIAKSVQLFGVRNSWKTTCRTWLSRLPLTEMIKFMQVRMAHQAMCGHELTVSSLDSVCQLCKKLNVRSFKSIQMFTHTPRCRGALFRPQRMK